MAATPTMKTRDVWGTRYSQFVTLAFPNPYTVGGETVDLKKIELAAVDYVIFPETDAVGATMYEFRWIPATNKVMVIVAATGIEAGAIDLSGLTAVKAIFVGTK